MMIQGKGNMKNWFILAALLFVMVVAGEVWGVQWASAAAKPVKLRMMMPGEPFGPGPLGAMHGANATAEPIVCNVMEPLVDYSKDGPVPRLATKWEHSADFTKWRLYLRKGVKFHNGADFTARDVVEFAKWNIELKDVSQVYHRVPFKEAVAVDNYTVDLVFTGPQPLFLVTARSFLIPPVAISRDNREMYKINPIGTGPYRFVEWKRGQHIRLSKFEGYWGPKPQIDDVEIIFRAEEGIRLAALMAGEVDWVYDLSTDSTGRAPKVARMPSPETVWLRFDEYIQTEFGKESILADKKLRLAIEYAIDRKALVALYKGFGTPSLGQFASPGDFGFNPNLKSRPYDLEKARALVREAGAVGKVVTFVGAAGRWPKDREVAEAITNMIEKSGLKVKLMLMPDSEVSKYKWVLGPNRQYKSDILIGATDTLLEVEERYPWGFIEGGRVCTLKDPETARLYKKALAETDLDKRGKNLAEAWAYLYEEAHYAPLFKLEWIWGIARNLEWNVDVAGRPFFADMRFTD